MDWDRYKNVSEDIFELIGRTPLLKIKRIPKLEGCDFLLLGKIEWYSPTGSLKDRIYYHMIKKAIERGDLKPGMEILESSTGNAGISCAFVGRLFGYPVIIVMPKGMSEERKILMRVYGAKLVFTPGGESDVDLCLKKVDELKRENPGKYWEPGQFSNPDNTEAHYLTTGPEIWEQTNGEVDAFVATQGTGGTITGVARYFKEKGAKTKFYAVEPAEAPLLSKGVWGSHRIEGIGDGFVPRNLDLSLLDGVITTSSREAIEMAQKLSLEEGLFCGISSGSNVIASIKLAKRHPEFKVIVTMINDSGQRYFSTPLCGVKKELKIPEREHPMDDYTKDQLKKYRPSWEILE